MLFVCTPFSNSGTHDSNDECDGGNDQTDYNDNHGAIDEIAENVDDSKSY